MLAGLATAGAGAYETGLERRAIEQALDIAHSSLESTHTAFHDDYRFHVLAPPVDFVEIVTPFRRVVLSAETNARTGRRMFGQHESRTALQPDPDRLEVYVELTFHPMNTYLGVPAYDVLLVPAGAPAPPVAPGTIDRLPRHGARLEDPYLFPYPPTPEPGLVAGSAPLIGGTIVARFRGEDVDAKGVYVVVVKDGKRDIGRTRRIDLSLLR